jgi:hypothetical protein
MQITPREKYSRDIRRVLDLTDYLTQRIGNEKTPPNQEIIDLMSVSKIN